MNNKPMIDVMNDLVHVQAERAYWYQRGEGQIPPSNINLAALLARLAEESTHFQSDIMAAVRRLGAKPDPESNGPYYREWKARIGASGNISKTLTLFYPKMEEATILLYNHIAARESWPEPLRSLLQHHMIFIGKTRQLVREYGHESARAEGRLPGADREPKGSK